ncbi:MAG: protein-tyrosine phosphatase family protein [Planctomycetota bacterium]|jgi:protein-tyrosine phosphatase
MSQRVDADRIAPKLYQGSLPPQGWALARSGFKVLVLAAREYQPPAWSFPGVDVIRLPMDDVDRPLNEAQRARVKLAAQIVSQRARRGERVLVTCAAGLNRSGLIVGTALKLAGLGGCDAVRRIRRARGPLALSNPSFVQALSGLRRCRSVARR